MVHQYKLNGYNIIIDEGRHSACLLKLELYGAMLI